MSLRSEVLNSFKKLHKTRKYVFSGDDRALKIVRDKINEEFHKNINVTDRKIIQDLIKLAKDVEHEIKTTVVQAKEVRPGVFQARILPETVKFDSVPYNEELVGLHTGGNTRKSNNKCCKEPEKK